jgi:mRNA deadenylase 3'-5' endonuclease subunit Ccr4
MHLSILHFSCVWNENFGKQIEGKLKLLRRLGLLSRSKCKELGNLPRADIPSDHYPLIAEFMLKH